jgi:hypothetical protein
MQHYTQNKTLATLRNLQNLGSYDAGHLFATCRQIVSSKNALGITD